ncbi:phosphate ABC transporter substrate-binding protein [Betaproteobacteria bacterium]|nr:phosphate ABC transporter substrate-binding protein [Betaproteobacteria bacterium]GHT97860.1 phosphate ABC transporter substrate-binding protein [Betaproteobacteria bacterium]GHU21460.1 phosphate ABC transporter substrate-binding protein [Betaproteobacteria bacterium]GHU28929.1 phosphate ABC transporter substrate-binding protein [Betaproteobacteria bacterium]
MSTKKYWIVTLLLTVVILPLLSNGSLFILAAATSLLSHDSNNTILAAIVYIVAALAALAILAIVPFFYGKKINSPEKFTTRYGPFVLPMVYTLLAWIIISFVSGGDFSRVPHPSIKILMWLFAPLLPYFFTVFFALFGGYLWQLPLVVTFFQIIFVSAFALGTWRGKRLATHDNRLLRPSVAFIFALYATAGITTYIQYHSVLHPDPENDVQEEGRSRNSYGNMLEYHIFEENNKFIQFRHAPSLRLEPPYPRLDGAIALLPVYGAAAQAIYIKTEDSHGYDDRKQAVLCRNTPNAYRALISGDADMIFAAAPSEDQQKLAAEKGLTLTLTPIAKEAFVFLINEQNPVKSLTTDQIRAIYSSEIDNWNKLGGPDEKILAFQRNKDSGSQTAMEQKVMRGTPMRKPLEAEYHGDMGGIMRAVADYHNSPDALGYSFRYYATTMNTVRGVALLSVNGIAPTPGNIRNGSYPFISDVYIVTARPLSENAQKLLDWFLSDEGQQLIADVGYVPIR